MTPRKSVRAAARRLYEEKMGEGGVSAESAPPTPDPSPPLAGLAGGGEKKAPELMAQVRALYEATAVPVREIARRAGVAERTLYKYARKQNWKPRYAWTPDGARPVGRAARLRWSDAQEKEHERASQFAPAKGAGGRFIRREDIGEPFAQGLKALDPAGRAAAAAACAEAERAAERARLEAEVYEAWEARTKAMRALNRALDAAIKHRKAWKGRPLTEAARISEAGVAAVCRARSNCVTSALAWEKDARETLQRFDADGAAAAVTSASDASS